MERKEFDIVVMETLHRLEGIQAIKKGDYSISLIKTHLYQEGTLKGCGEFYLYLGDGFKNIRIEICISEKGNIYAVSFDELKWLVPYDVQVLRTICEVIQ